MSIHLTITSLPQDIIYEILSRSYDFYTLRSFLLAHSRFHNEFERHQILIVKHVFINQISHNKPKTSDAIEVMRRYINTIPDTRISDVIILREAIWPYLEAQLPNLRSVKCAVQQSQAYGQLAQHEKALILLETVWKTLIAQEGYLLRLATVCAEALANCYREAERFDESFALMESVVQRLLPLSKLFATWAVKLRNAYRNDGRFEQCHEYQLRIWRICASGEGWDSNFTLMWARFVVDDYLAMGLEDDAIGVQKEVWIQRASRENYSGFGRWRAYLISTLLYLGRTDEASDIDTEIWNYDVRT